MSDLPKDVVYDNLTEAYIVDLGDDTVAEVMGRRRGQKAIELSNMLAENARLEAQLAEAREAIREAYEVYTGSEGFEPETAPETYQQRLLKQVAGILGEALTRHGGEG